MERLHGEDVPETAQEVNTRYTPGDLVWWHDQPNGGYGPSRSVRATFVRYNGTKVTIAAELRSGGTRERRVSLANIRPRQAVAR